MASWIKYQGSLFKTLLLWTVIPTASLITITYLILAMVGIAWTPYSCTTEVRERFADVSGFSFEISETDCDTLAKDASISVFASRTGGVEKTLLLKYGPAGVDDLPTITSTDQHAVLISIKKISDLIFHRTRLKELSVVYKIDIIEYPENSTNINQ
jgi:hypothetical protein